MFSDRTRWDQRPNRLAEAWARRRAAGLACIDLTESNPTRCGFRYPEDEILRALSDPRALRYQPDPRGLLSAREAIAAELAATGDMVDPEDLVLTASTSEAYSWLFKLLCNPGDRILAPRPSYPLFEYLAGLEEVSADPYPLRYDSRWEIDLEALESAIDERTRAIVVVHPNNPTGNLVGREEARRVGEICAARDVVLISDEVFLDYLFLPGGQSVEQTGSLAATAPALTFALGGLSKSAGLPQIKVGWIRAGGPPEARRAALARLEVIADTYLSVNTPAQCALPALLRAGRSVREQILERIRSNRSWCERRRGSDASWELLRADGGWSAVLRIPRLRSEEERCLELVEEDGVLAHPGYFFDFPAEAFLVVSVLPEPVRFQRAMEIVLHRVGAEGTG